MLTQETVLALPPTQRVSKGQNAGLTVSVIVRETRPSAALSRGRAHLRCACLQKGGPMRRGLLLLSAVLIALAVAPAAIANKPTREINPAPDDRLITGQCTFPVLGHIEG